MQVKSAFTRSYNKEAHATPYTTAAIIKKSRRSTSDDYDDDENEEQESERESDDEITSNPMIRTSKKGRVESSKEAVETSLQKGKGKGKAGSQGSRKKGK